jgi:hypothetical protein
VSQVNRWQQQEDNVYRFGVTDKLSHGRLQPRAHRFSVYRRARHRPSAVGLLLLLLLLLLTCTSSSLVALLLGGLLLVVGCSFRLLLRPLLCAALLLRTTTARK